jgi:hypothetical protein
MRTFGGNYPATSTVPSTRERREKRKCYHS